jgi:hypothetical protein
MKYSILLLAAAVSMLALVSGCKAKHSVDTGRLSTGFASASGDLKANVDKAIAAIKAENHAEAIDTLSVIAEAEGLTDDQKQAMMDTLIDIQVIVSENPPTDADALFEKIDALNTKLYM